MRIYFAPMEGITTYTYRNLHWKYFGGADAYFTPFLSPGPGQGMSVKELRDILPENNQGTPVIPQLLTNRAEDFVSAAGRLADYGYREINFNLGCPSGTVTAKKKGSGFLGEPEALDRFFDRVFSDPLIVREGLLASVKTRIGLESPAEWPRLLEIYNRYPLKELIIHPRVRKDFYKNHPDWDAFRLALSESKNPLVYNGDLFSEEAYFRFREEFPKVDTVMLGRGLIQDPALAKRLSDLEENGKWGKPRQENEHQESEPRENGSQESRHPADLMLGRLRAFHDELLLSYRDQMSGDRNVLFKMKEIWSYLLLSFPEKKKAGKRLMKAVRMEDYRAAVNEILDGSDG